ncbi:MAG: PP0621 family protein [Gammaproteobacteria bacterium]
MRTLVIIIILALIVMIAKRLLQKPQAPARRSQTNEHMVQCANCGIYIPEQEALQRAGRYYCSQTHLDEDLH